MADASSRQVAMPSPVDQLRVALDVVQIRNELIFIRENDANDTAIKIAAEQISVNVERAIALVDEMAGE
ncbi:hypothetical protein Sj15T_01630 [Sphingobium sp. TA15]|uniref:Histidine kinase n=1 Tax=Sphingobium indicum (strain DSM 16413 / CCM 7287 / MTCC 6362 / UT26 / NBRC 101211 / UT26S) TaxID=452662 RepID=D4YZP2_SPHIU|nr:hypothetical protein [Sphingobium indicum]BAI95824.1 hypothetical protein SJA_C1-09900 [Sphingobium indicum UT26S]BDD65142.1 hypothetical protein Sj15T_01630 [Sphingobium sp. TA15]